MAQAGAAAEALRVARTMLAARLRSPPPPGAPASTSKEEVVSPATTRVTAEELYMDSTPTAFSPSEDSVSGVTIGSPRTQPPNLRFCLPAYWEATWHQKTTLDDQQQQQATRELSEELEQLKERVAAGDRCLREQAHALDEVRSEIRELRQSLQVVLEAGQLMESQAAMAPVLAASDPALAPSGPFTVWLDRSSGGELGLELDENTLTVAVVDEGGLIAELNHREPDAAVRPGCRILEVNGERSVEGILDRLIRDTMLEVTLARGQ